MAIQPKPRALVAVNAPAANEAAEAFIAGAPDAASAGTPRRVRARKEQISLTLAPELIERVDRQADKMGLSRAAWISTAIYNALQEVDK